MVYYYYIGRMNRITPCRYNGQRGNRIDCCNDGQCPGYINDRCAFGSQDTPVPEFMRYFIKLPSRDYLKNIDISTIPEDI